MTLVPRLLAIAACACVLAGQTQSPGTVKVNPKDGLSYVWIPPGAFQIGCSQGDTQCFDPEIPPVKREISRGFWMGNTEVTQEAWQRVMGTNPSSHKGEKLPVENITWDDAAKYCGTVGMRLPTEAEWEYAARAATTAARYLADVNAVAWHGGNSQNKPHQVATKLPNAWGLYDMLGNVWEWVADWYGDHYLPVDLTDPRGPNDGTMRVRRGGAFDDAPRYARASFRSRQRPSYHFGNLGVRCAGN